MMTHRGHLSEVVLLVKSLQLYGCAGSDELLIHVILVPSSFLLLVVRPGAPSSVLVPSSDALVPK